jgi:predicted Zn-dependent peptidase
MPLPMPLPMPLRVCATAFVASIALGATDAHAGTTEWSLPSGLVVLHRPDSRFPVVRVVVTVGGGTADTAPGQRPLAHLAEHVAFRAHLAGGPAYQTLRAAGCGVNGTTRLDTTVFTVECPTDAAALAVRFAVSVATHDFDGIKDDDVLAEARVVLAETTQRLDAGVLVYDEAMQGVFTDDHPYRLDERIPEDLLALRRADVEGFFRAHYVPAEVVIAVEGDVDAGALAGLISHSAGDGFAHPRQRRGEIAEWPAGAIPIQWLSPFAATWFRDPEHPDRALESGHLLPKATRTPPPVPEPEPEPRSARHSGTWPQVQVAWYLPPADHHNWVHLSESEVFATDALRKVFGADGVISGECDAYLGTRGSALLCTAEVETEDQMAPVGRRIAKAFQHELTWNEGKRLIAADDVDARSWRAVVRRDQAGIEDLEELSAYRLATGRFNLEGERMKALDSGGGSSGWVALRSAWLGPARAVTTLVEPESRASMAPEGTSEGVSGAAQAVRWPATALGHVAAEQAEESVLDNGLRTVVLPLPRAEIAAWRLAVPSLPGLEYLEPVVDAALRTPDRFEGNSLSYNWYVRDDVLAANQQGTWEPRNLLRSLWGTVESLRVVGVRQAFRRLVMSEVYAGRSAYAWIERAWRRATREDPERDGLPEIDEAIGTRGAVDAYLAARYQPGRATLLLMGAVDTDARARIVEELGDWSASSSPPPELRLAKRRAPTPEAIVLDRDGAGRTVSVTWACPTTGLGATAPDPLTASLLGVLARDRLYDAVRASSGLTYTPWAWTESRWGGVDLYLSAATELGREGEVLTALRAVADDLGKGRAEPWLDAARRQVTADELREGASVLGLARTLASGVVRHGSLPDLRANRAALAGVDAARVAGLLRTCGTVGAAILVGPAEEVAAGLAGSDLPVRVLDWRAEHMALVQRWLPEMQKREADWLERARRK